MNEWTTIGSKTLLNFTMLICNICWKRENFLCWTFSFTVVYFVENLHIKKNKQIRMIAEIDSRLMIAMSKPMCWVVPPGITSTRAGAGTRRPSWWATPRPRSTTRTWCKRASLRTGRGGTTRWVRCVLWFGWVSHGLVWIYCVWFGSLAWVWLFCLESVDANCECGRCSSGVCAGRRSPGPGAPSQPGGAATHRFSDTETFY